MTIIRIPKFHLFMPFVPLLFEHKPFRPSDVVGSIFTAYLSLDLSMTFHPSQISQKSVSISRGSLLPELELTEPSEDVDC